MVRNIKGGWMKKGDKVEITHQWWPGLKGEIKSLSSNWGEPTAYVEYTENKNKKLLQITLEYLRRV